MTLRRSESWSPAVLGMLLASVLGACRRPLPWETPADFCQLAGFGGDSGVDLVPVGCAEKPVADPSCSDLNITNVAPSAIDELCAECEASSPGAACLQSEVSCSDGESTQTVQMFNCVVQKGS